VLSVAYSSAPREAHLRSPLRVSWIHSYCKASIGSTEDAWSAGMKGAKGEVRISSNVAPAKNTRLCALASVLTNSPLRLDYDNWPYGALGAPASKRVPPFAP
jgi:hypothetical protein